MLKNIADRVPVALVLALTTLDFCLYFLVDNAYVLGLYFYATIIPRAQICAWNHHHQHTFTFHLPALDRLLELFYSLHTGATTNLWVLHHVYGHHKHYMDQTKDESRWLRKDGTPMSELGYSFNILATAYYRAYKVGKDYPKEQMQFIFYSLVTFALVAALVAYRPVPGLLIFVLPMVMSLFVTAWATHGHHAGLATDDHYKASFNNTSPLFNMLTGNLGYHTAHHLKGGLHWSKLPAFHEKIKDKIPDELVQRALVS